LNLGEKLKNGGFTPDNIRNHTGRLRDRSLLASSGKRHGLRAKPPLLRGKLPPGLFKTNHLNSKASSL